MRRKRTSVSRKKAGRTAFVVTGSRLFVLSQVLLPAMAQNATSVPIDRPVGGPLDFLEDTVNATLPSNPSPSETTAAPVSVPVGSVAISNETTSSPQALPITTTAPISAASAPSTNAPTQSPVAQPQGGASTNGTSFTSAPAVSFSGGSTNSPVSSLDLCGGLDCQHDSTCRLGNATYNMDTHVGFHTVTNMNGYHCQCPEGFGGLDCSRPYQECGINGARCYHGGVCLPESELEDIEYASYCECSKASHNGQRYAGKYCEVAVEQENYCNDRSRLFCLNGGSCPTGDMLICSCKEGYFGEHCEYVTPKGPECTLECLNEGVCKVGRVNGPWGNRDDFYCDCPRGYGGIQCEHLAETCGDGDTVCLHGASCQTAVAANGKTSFTCSCPDPYLGGSGCEQKRRMELCNPQVAPEYSLSMAVPAFCLNGGTCGDLVTSEFVEFGCVCPPLFEGPHCEFLKTAEAIGDVDDLINPPGSDRRAAGVVAVSVAFAALAAVLGLFIFRQVRRIKHSRQRKEDVILNLQSFRDENFGAISASGSMLFPGVSPPPSTIPEASGSNSNFASGELLHDIDIS